MQREGPFLEQLTRRLADTPPEFLESPWVAGAGAVSVVALVNDLARSAGAPLSNDHLAELVSAGKSDPAAHRNWLSLCAIACWLLADPQIRQAGMPSQGLVRFFLETAQELASTATAAFFIQNPDRREELARVALSSLNMRPAGETIAQAQDRLQAISATERSRMLKAARAAEERARKIREELVRKAAEEAADKYTRE